MIKLKEIINLLKPIKFIGDENDSVNEVIQMDVNNTRQDVLFWVNSKNLHLLNKCSAGTVITSIEFIKEGFVNASCNYILVENPRIDFIKVLKNYFVRETGAIGISDRAIIGKNVILGKNISIAANTIIEDDCVIGDNTVIGYNNVIHKKTIIGKNVTIGSNNIIGSTGFGYEKDKDGLYEMMPHIGNVLINDKVEIGNNTCIDRAVLGSTTIGENVKIDNLVHVAHGVKIGSNSLVIANVMIGGSTTIGENVWVAPSVSIINKVNIGNNSVLGMSATVIRDVEEGSVVAGNPAKLLRKTT